jgi:uroporphyrin-3 C-methyltransferase
MAQKNSDKNSKQDQVETSEPNKETNSETATDSAVDKQADALAKLEAEIRERQEADKETVEDKSKQQTSASKPESPSEKEPSASDNKPSAAEKKPVVSQKESAPTKPKASAPQSKSAKPQKSGPGWLASFAFLFSVAALAGLGFMFWQNQMWLKNQEQLEQLKQQSLLTTQQTLNQQQAQITDLLTKLTSQDQNQEQTQQALISMQNRLKELGESQPNYWLAAEAGYLINLAERRLLVEQDINTATQLLVDAEQRLAAMQDPSVFHIRQAISADLADIRAIKQPATDDVYLALSGLLSEVEQIKFAQVYIPDAKQEVQQTAQVSDNVNDWQENLKLSLKRFFAHFITIRQQETQVQPQLPSDQKWFVKANITTQLLMAQNATLAHNQQRYQDAIKQLLIWLPQYFDKSEPKVVAFVTTLEELLTQSVGLQIPAGVSSQPLISKYVATQLNLKENNND